MQQTIIGWDIGGAHVKAALLNSDGLLQQVCLQPCPLWQGIEQLHLAVTQVTVALKVTQATHVITMTGELVDCFASREAGVQQIIAAMVQLLPAQALFIFAGKQGFLPVEQVTVTHVEAIASANWLATAYFVAQQLQYGLLIDIGSTTTDILLLNNKTVQAQGFTDYQRLVSGELIYTGIIRTAVMAVARQAMFNGQQQGLMAEYFATMADVYRVTRELQEAHDHSATADGAEKTLVASARRLSRMTGHDFRVEDMALWQQFALTLREQQLQLLTAGVTRQLSRGLLPPQSCFIGAGVGRFLVRTLAQQLGYAYRDFDELITTAPYPRSFNERESKSLTAADCAPAVAVALLFASALRWRLVF
ncbi:MAG: H4MPT-linked C1 transfer pathway protein [Methylococcaceae bacterium]|nr:H4MPT-linked C1 transfer pathway protein [Methylococcaceae bacterium]